MAVRWDEYLRTLDTTTELLRRVGLLGERDLLASEREDGRIRLFVLEWLAEGVYLDCWDHEALRALGSVWVGSTSRQARDRMETANAVLSAWASRLNH